ncbi:uncharacterized protein LOC110267522 [Arachis ipaensis]|uniref:uncharacterized protein LOC110267522 n=1 Tax=Arachis ipaensis TaxID=130454 RepID=UPI000A2AFEC8|nr:uncharacterized protein LOC110267522 [Arachis ipaensis]
MVQQFTGCEEEGQWQKHNGDTHRERERERARTEETANELPNDGEGASNHGDTASYDGDGSSTVAVEAAWVWGLRWLWGLRGAARLWGLRGAARADAGASWLQWRQRLR